MCIVVVILGTARNLSAHCSPVAVPLAVLVVRHGFQVGQGDDVATVGAETLLVKATLALLQLAVVLVGDADVGVVVDRRVCVHAHAGHRRVVTLQEVLVHPVVALEEEGGRGRRRGAGGGGGVGEDMWEMVEKEGGGRTGVDC